MDPGRGIRAFRVVSLEQAVVSCGPASWPSPPHVGLLLRQHGLDPDTDKFMLGGSDRELEYLFSDAQWAAVANEKWKRNDGTTWQEEEIAALRHDKKFSSALLNMFKTESSDGPQGKPEMVYELAMSFRHKSDVPTELLDVFDKLVFLANPEP